MLFSVLINWIISLQILNQSSNEKNIKIITISMAIIMGIIAGFVISLTS
jgi:hypothetical protein